MVGDSLHQSPCRSNIHIVNNAGTSGNDEPRVDYSGTESQGEDEVDPSRILNALPLKIKSFICWIFSLNHCPVHRWHRWHDQVDGPAAGMESGLTNGNGRKTVKGDLNGGRSRQNSGRLNGSGSDDMINEHFYDVPEVRCLLGFWSFCYWF